MKSSIVLAVETHVKPLGLAGNFEKNARFIASLGFKGAELSVMHVERMEIESIKKIVNKYKLEIPAIGSGRYFLQNGLSLSTNDKKIRAMAVNTVKRSLEFVSALDSHFIIGVAQGKNELGQKEGVSHLIESLKLCAEHAEELGITLLLEPINRYQSATVRTLQQGVEVIEAVGLHSIKLLADTHHMNIEEQSFKRSLKETGKHIAHMHFSDSNRLAPGFGHINFHEIALTLKELEYKGFASAEILTEPDQFKAAEQTIKFIRSLPF